MAKPLRERPVRLLDDPLLPTREGSPRGLHDVEADQQLAPHAVPGARCAGAFEENLDGEGCLPGVPEPEVSPRDMIEPRGEGAGMRLDVESKAKMTNGGGHGATFSFSLYCPRKGSARPTFWNTRHDVDSFPK